MVLIDANRNKKQQEQVRESLEKVCRYFDYHLFATASDVRRDLKMSPNTVHRNLQLLGEGNRLEEMDSSVNSGRGKKKLYRSFTNPHMKQNILDAYRLKRQRDQGKTNFEITLLIDMIKMSETTHTKSYVAKLFGLGSAQSFERLIQSYPTLIEFRKRFRDGTAGQVYPHYKLKDLL